MSKQINLITDECFHDVKIVNQLGNNLQELRYENFEVGKYVYSTLTFLLKTSKINLADEFHYNCAKVLVFIGIYTYINTKKLIIDKKIDLAIVFNGRFVSTAAVKHAAMDSGIDYLLHERGYSLNKYILTDKSFHTITQQTADIHDVSNNVPESILRLHGSSFFGELNKRSFDDWFSFSHRMEKEKFPEQLLNINYVVFYASSDDELETTDGNVLNAGFGNQRESIFALEKAALKAGLKLVVRVHPNLADKNPAEYEYLNELNNENCLIIKPTDNYDSYELAKRAFIVTTFVSSMSIESLYLKKPVILLGKSRFCFSDEIMKPKNMDELDQCVSNPVIPKSNIDAFKYGYYISNHGYEFNYYKPRDSFNGEIKGLNMYGLND